MRLLLCALSSFFFNVCTAQVSDTTTLLQNSTINKTLPGSHNGKLHTLIIPVACITYGVISLHSSGLKKLDADTKYEIKEDHPGYATKLDNYLQYTPALAVYGLNAAGIKGKNNLRDRTIIYGISTLLSSATVLSLKKITKVERPDGSGANSFPSGHTTTAFAAAEFLREEYKDQSPWYGIAGYGAAAATGILRLYNNRHWVSDVVAGAGFGVLSTKIAYWIYPALKRKLFKNKPMHAIVMPFYQNHSTGFAMVYHFPH